MSTEARTSTARYLTTSQVMERISLPNRRAARRWMDEAAAHSGVSVLRGEGRAESRIRAAVLDAYLTALETGPLTTPGVTTGASVPGSVTQPPRAAADRSQFRHPGSGPQASPARSQARRAIELPPDFGGIAA